jgi:outer membrane lipoprotein-sorting protein
MFPKSPSSATRPSIARKLSIFWGCLCLASVSPPPGRERASHAAEPPPQPSAEQVLDAIDRNMVSDSRQSTLTMTVEDGRRTRSYTMQSWGRGAHDSAMEYQAPARDKGTRMLKLGEEMWLYMPSVDKVQKISGHMLRQGMMGSDVSYEDLLATTELQRIYDAKVVGAETLDGRPCWKLELLARDPTVAYPRRLSWVDQELSIPMRQELYALSGMLLKSWSMSEIKDFPGGRRFPTKMQVEDKLREGSRTTLSFDSITFGVELPADVFSLRWLERK